LEDHQIRRYVVHRRASLVLGSAAVAVIVSLLARSAVAAPSVPSSVTAARPAAVSVPVTPAAAAAVPALADVITTAVQEFFDGFTGLLSLSSITNALGSFASGVTYAVSRTVEDVVERGIVPAANSFTNAVGGALIGALAFLDTGMPRAPVPDPRLGDRAFD
jgi:hypothetical protein